MFISPLKALAKALSKQKTQTTEVCFDLVGFGGIFEADNLVCWLYLQYISFLIGRLMQHRVLISWV